MDSQFINGDCLQYMANMDDGSVDVIVTDPPYGVSYQSNKRTKSEKFAVLKNDDNDMRFIAYKEFYRLLKNDSVCIVFASWKNVAKDIAVLEKMFDIKNIIVWHKRGGGIGDLKHTLYTDYELAVVCHKGKCKIRGKREGSVWDVTKVHPSKMLHPTQKPVQLISKLIEKYSDENDLIFDPFAGSGTTALACMETNRKYLCIELDKKYFNIALDRLNGA